MTEIIQLISGTTKRAVFCRVASIGMREFYEANTRDFYPQLKFVVADYLEYQNEQLVEYEGRIYHVLRTYRTGTELEIVVIRASAEEGGLYS